MSIEMLPYQCRIVRCDGCEEQVLSGMDDDEWHFASEEEANQTAKDMDWEVKDGRFLCTWCIESRNEEASHDN